MAQIWKSRAASHCDGNVAIEFGFILPVLLLFTLGIMDAGRLVWTYITLSRAADAAARCGAIDQTGTCPNIPAYAATQAWGINGGSTASRPRRSRYQHQHALTVCRLMRPILSNLSSRGSRSSGRQRHLAPIPCR